MNDRTRLTTSLATIVLSVMAVAFAFVLAGAAVSVAAVLPPGAPRSPMATYESAELGYRVELPAQWRRSTALSRVPDNGYLHGHDVFTARTTTDEDAATQASHGLGPAWQGTVLVEVYRNPAGLTPLQWATRPEWDWRNGQVVETNVVFAGRVAVRITNGARFAVAYYVANGSEVFVVGTVKGPFRAAAATDSDMAAIATSFWFTR